LGDGPCRSSLQQLSANLGLNDRVHFLGNVPQDPNPHQFLDASVLCSHSEGFPNTLIEALAAACPVIATDVGGIKDVIFDNRTGLLVADDDDTGLVAAAERLIANPGLCNRLGTQGQRYVREHFHRQIVVENLMDFYASLTSRRCIRG
jgi:glycosyltransferase involved in cell wall biosynthesis